MATITKDLGIATAYGYAKSKGYTGTEEEFALSMASCGTVVDEAREYAEIAREAAESVTLTVSHDGNGTVTLTGFTPAE